MRYGDFANDKTYIPNHMVILQEFHEQHVKLLN